MSEQLKSSRVDLKKYRKYKLPPSEVEKKKLVSIGSPIVFSSGLEKIYMTTGVVEKTYDKGVSVCTEYGFACTTWDKITDVFIERGKSIDINFNDNQDVVTFNKVLDNIKVILENDEYKSYFTFVDSKDYSNICLRRIQMFYKNHKIDMILTFEESASLFCTCSFKNNKANFSIDGNIDPFLVRFNIFKKFIKNELKKTTEQEKEQKKRLKALKRSEVKPLLDENQNVVKRGRGRPRKYPVQTNVVVEKRKRGRPRKVQL